MIRGIITAKGPKEEGKPTPETLIFVCPGCKERHAIFISKTGHPNPTDYYDIGPYHVWLYKHVNDNLIEVIPSFDASAVCGYHGPSQWQVEVAPETNPESDNMWLSPSV